MKKRFFVVAAVMIGGLLHAQQDSSTLSLDEVVLTANKYPRKQQETGKVITVIDRRQLEKSPGKTLGELLNTVAGTTIIGANNNGGTNQTVSLRGASAGNTLILLDGIPVNDPSVISNYFDLNFISLEQVERIEILKGGQSTLYGSDAVAGVINIISKKAPSNKVSVTGNFSGGSYHTLQQNLGLSGSSGSSNYSIHYTHLGSDGFSTANDSTGEGRFDNDFINQHVISARAGTKLAKNFLAQLFGTYSNYKTGLDASAFTDDRDYTAINKNLQAGMGLQYNHATGNTKFSYSYHQSKRDYRDDSLHKSNPFAYYSRSSYTGRTHFLEIYNNWKWEHVELLVGTDYRFNNTDQSYFSTGIYGPYSAEPLSASMHQWSPYLSAVYTRDGLIMEAGGRWNRHSEYGNNFTFTFNPAYLINDRLKFFANLYSAFKTPTLYQLFDPFAGNIDLLPEKGMISEAGVAYTGQHARVRMTGFYRKTRDAIVYTFNPFTFESRYQNASEQSNYGLELEGNINIGSVGIRGNYTYTDGSTRSGYDGTGSPLPKDTSYFNLYRIPKHALNVHAGWQANKKLFLSAQVRAVSKREEFVYGSHPSILDGYTTVDLYGEYKLEKIIKLFVDLKNVTDTEYFDILGYNSRRFNFTIGVCFRLDGVGARRVRKVTAKAAKTASK